ncbi:MAG: DUF5666 domain-containing protein [Anaerolineales bacterium]
MKNLRFLPFVLTIATLVLSACSAVAVTATPAAVGASQKVEAMPVAFIGIVDSIAGDQWVISGTTVTVDESVVRDGPFNAGDRIKVEGLVSTNGSLTVTRVESPTPQEAATLTPFPAGNTNEAINNANTNDANINDGNINDSNINDDNGNGNSNDDNSNDDHGSNSNDDNSNDDNGGKSNDDNGKDDNSGKGGGDDDDRDDNSNDD